MSRETQFIGLNGFSKHYIESHAIHTERKECPHCHHVVESIPISVKCGEVKGMFDEPCHDLQEYTDKETGRKFQEFVQCSPWSSGPCIFLALKFSDGEKEIIGQFIWSDEEIDEYT